MSSAGYACEVADQFQPAARTLRNVMAEPESNGSPQSLIGRSPHFDKGPLMAGRVSTWPRQEACCRHLVEMRRSLLPKNVKPLDLARVRVDFCAGNHPQLAAKPINAGALALIDSRDHWQRVRIWSIAETAVAHGSAHWWRSCPRKVPIFRDSRQQWAFSWFDPA